MPRDLGDLPGVTIQLVCCQRVGPISCPIANDPVPVERDDDSLREGTPILIEATHNLVRTGHTVELGHKPYDDVTDLGPLKGYPQLRRPFQSDALGRGSRANARSQHRTSEVELVVAVHRAAFRS
ncbi:hypothetical protein IU500_14970 [Nocardia terpenica]|uniref:hypothetical protein n=1 Tax=Nocardia terpenica TaxID=455432 RepID=UPI001895199A|nr:hypothetical protein [Nocardia terpenica]MBF6061424.1 hypothetical protein [Nocardia terpenica]MBF6105347.1 hypothetical protein [Nocardia terpenica]MBF6113183.1 hypothetical protein [Nocardia terpenica]MBF6119313.1 hypothetical protein [Nocardia terpenica]MBF6152961.1 hypothetical protein [Nocardia terpenica]